MIERAKNTDGPFLGALYGILVGLVLFNLSPAVSPSATTARLGLILMAVLIGAKWGDVLNLLLEKLGWYTWLQVAVIGYNVLLWAIRGNDDYMQISRNLHFFVYCYVGSIMTVVLFKADAHRFNVVVSVVMTFHALLVFLAFLWPPWYLFGINTFSRITNFGDVGQGRVSAFGFGGADTSVLQFIGVISAALLLPRQREWRTRFILFVATGVCMLATVFMGRTGFLASLFVLVALIMVFIWRREFTALSGFALMAVIVVFAWGGMWEYLANKNAEADYIRQWFSLIFGDELLYQTNYEQFASVPSITWETIIGTGEVGTAAGYNASGHDSGYVQTYYASGLVFAGIFYSSYLWYLGSLGISGRVGWLGFSAVLAMFVIEVKEPFMFKYALPYYLNSLFLMYYISAERVARPLLPSFPRVNLQMSNRSVSPGWGRSN